MFLADSPTTSSSILAAAGSLVAGFGGILLSSLTVRRARRHGEAAEGSFQGALMSSTRANLDQEELAHRLQALADSMRRSAEAAQEASSELDAQAEAARRLQREAQRAREIASLHEGQVKAIRDLLGHELEFNRRLIRRDTIIIGIASFIAGGFLTLALTLLAH
jgi:hypothetical protein